MPYPNYYFPQNYQPISQPIQGNNNPINWVQGESSAKSFPVAPGNSVLLMDSEESIFYIKSTDQSGMPLPLRIFDYTERKSPNDILKEEKTTSDYVSREEFITFRDGIEQTIKELKVLPVKENKKNE